MTALLQVEDFALDFVNRDGVARAVDGVSWQVAAGETLGIVGESGCGKSVTALSVLRLLPSPPARIAGGRILFDGRDLLTMPEAALRRIRGNAISMIFQDPMSSLNPVLSIGVQLAETVLQHERMNRAAALARGRELLELVRIPEAARRLKQHPHELSGGMRQRVMIAMALACNPRLLLADEPTTALDVTIQAQILALLEELQHRLGTAIVLITHDLGVVAEIATRVIVMYAGRVVEEAGTDDLFDRPLHPYTRGLIGAAPRLDDASRCRLAEIPGMVPNPLSRPPGCAFAPRCAIAVPRCHVEAPSLREAGDGHRVACWEALP